MAVFQTTSSTSGAPYFSNTDPFQTAYSPGGDPFRTAYTLRAPLSSRGVGSPPSSSYMVYAAEVTSSHADELVKSLAQQREAEVQKAAVVTVRELPAKTVFIGDRGSLTHHTGLSSPVAASVPATRPASEVTVVGVGVTVPPEEIAGLSQEVAAKEMELRVLRQQAEKTQRDADRLRSQLRDANLRLQQASGDVGTLAAKVEATAGRTHLVLDASAQQIQEQVAGFQRRLARMEFELKDKEKDIQDLRLVLDKGREKVSLHGDRVAAMQQGQFLNGELTVGVDTSKAVSVWKDASVARIEQEQANTALARERRAVLEQHDAVDEEINAIRNSIYRAEQRCKHHASEAARKQQHLDALIMEERLCRSAAELGAERAAEHKRIFAAEERMLSQRIADEKSRLGAKSAQASKYDVAEEEALRAQMQLMALTMCVKEISRTLRGPSGGAGDHIDRLDNEVDVWFQKAREERREVPALQRVSAGEYMLDGKPVHMAMSESGQLCARLPDGGLLRVEDYFRHIENLKRQEEATGVTVVQPTMAPTTYGVEAGPKPLHTLVSPMTISLASPVVVA